jgi:hypothetical protein
LTDAPRNAGLVGGGAEVADILSALLAAGLTHKWLHEHDAVPWRMFELLVKDAEGMYRWPEGLVAARVLTEGDESSLSL